MRSALGVGRTALFRQVSTETLLLALLGGALGVALAFGLVSVIQDDWAHAIPRLDAVDGTAGCWPADWCRRSWRRCWPDCYRPASVADGPDQVCSRAPDQRAARGAVSGGSCAVTLAQTALTLALLVGAGLLIRTMINLSNVQSGYSTDRVLTMSVTSVQGDWADFHQRALERVSALPGVQHAAFAWGVPLTGNNWPAPVEIEGQPAAVEEATGSPCHCGR